MKLLSRILPIGNIVLDLPVSSKKRAFEQAGLLFENNNGIERAAVFDALFLRERLGSTGLGEGIAVPHGRVKGLEQSVAAFIRLAQPVAFDAPDAKPVSQLLCLMAPESAAQQHLDILPEVAERLSNDTLLGRQAVETNTGSVHRVLNTGSAGT